MSEFHGTKNDAEKMQTDKQSDEDFVFGSSGPCILEEYQVRVEEFKRDLAEKHHQIKQLQKDYEMLLQSSQQDVKNLEMKEKEIERLKRTVAKL